MSIEKYIEDGKNLLLNKEYIDNLFKKLICELKLHYNKYITNDSFSYDLVNDLTKKEFNDIVKYVNTYNRIKLSGTNRDMISIIRYNDLYISVCEYYMATCDVVLSIIDEKFLDNYDKNNLLFVDFNDLNIFYNKYFLTNNFDEDFYFSKFMY